MNLKREKKERREGNNSKFVPLRQDYCKIVLILLRNNPETTVNFVLLSDEYE